MHRNIIPLFFLIIQLFCEEARAQDTPVPLLAVDANVMAPELKLEPILHPKCAPLLSVPAQRTCSKIEEAKRLFTKISLRFVGDKKGNVVKREVALAVLPHDADTPEVIHLFTPLHPPSGKTFIPEVVGPVRYRVEHVSGQYAYKLVFRVTTTEGEEVQVLAGKHLFIPPSLRTTDKLAALEKARFELVYTPIGKSLYHEEFFRAGLAVVRSDMAKAFSMLEREGVPSKAFPGKLISEKYNAEQLVRVFAIEMTDPFRLYGLPYYGKPQVPESELMRYVFAEVFVWGDDAFRHLCSSANACGRMQFTNNSVKKGKNLYPGTYALMVEKCRSRSGAQILEPDFWRGTEDPVNSAVAAACLLDSELAALPREMIEFYERDPRVGLTGAIIGYNAGGFWSASVIKKVLEIWSKKVETFTLLNYREFPVEAFWGKKKGKPFFNQEPCYYVFKWFESWIDFQPKQDFVPNCGKGG